MYFAIFWKRIKILQVTDNTHLNSEKLVDRLNKAGVNYKLVAIEGAGHTPVNHMNDFEIKIVNFLAAILK